MNDTATETVKDLLPLTPDLNRDRLNKLRELFPDLFTDEGSSNETALKKLVVIRRALMKPSVTSFAGLENLTPKRKAFMPTTATLNCDTVRDVRPAQSDRWLRGIVESLKTAGLTLYFE